MGDELIMMDTPIEILNGAKTAFVDKNMNVNSMYTPRMLLNNAKKGQKVLSTIEEELSMCEEFIISVAFITMSGITPLLQTLKELEAKKVPGKILTTNYLTFSDPKALEKLASLSNIELRMYYSDDDEGFHTKGYIFQNKDTYHIIIGSSNLTLRALTKNKEWNVQLFSTEQGEYTEQILTEFNTLWTSKNTQHYDNFIESYRLEFEQAKKQNLQIYLNHGGKSEHHKLQPNAMQKRFIQKLKELRNIGAQRALLISATGTGKTYASAFALREENPSKVLFLVHREQIAKQAMKSYKKVFGMTKQFGLLSGNQKDMEADYLFATMQMMSKPEILQRFERQNFNIIVIDEVHRAGAESYQRIMNYFQPEFWLGMTASPERTDGINCLTIILPVRFV